MYASPAPQRRPLKSQQSRTDVNRDSNALRASVLDAALAIGIGSSRTVENWMFNTVDEEDEREDDLEDTHSPELTSATSGESTPGPFTPLTSPAALENEPRYFAPLRPVTPPTSGFSPSQPQLPLTNAKQHRGKLRKKAKDVDGYISDGGASKKAPKKKVAAQAKNADADSSDDGGYFSDFGRRKKSRTKKKKDKTATTVDGGDESDGGYLSEASKKKRGFFRLRSKSSKSSGLAETAPPVPSLPPPLPPSVQSLQVLPIAERFVRTPEPPQLPPPAALAVAGIAYDEDFERSRSTTPLARLRTKESIDSVSTADEPELETPSTSLSDHGQVSTESGPSGPAGVSPAKKGVRFTPSTRFSGPAPAVLDSAPPPPLLQPDLPISSPRPLTPTRTRIAPVPSPTPSDFSLVSASEFIEPSSAYIVPSPSMQSAPLPSSNGVQSTEFSAPRPSHLRVNLPSPSRMRFSLPPPTPPPTGPLPDVPDSPGAEVSTPISAMQPFAPQPRQQQGAFRVPPPSAYASISRSASPGPPSRAVSPGGIFSQQIPQIQRGRESPFPTRPVLPQAESTDLVRRTSKRVGMRPPPTIAVEDEYGVFLREPGPESVLSRSRSPVGRSGNVGGEERRPVSPGIVYDARDRGRPTTIVTPDDDVRSDVALFFFPPTRGAGEGDTLSPYHSRIAPESVHSDDGTSAADDASVYPPTARSRGAVDSYYFGTDTDSRPGSFIDGERSEDIRTRFVQRVGAMWDANGWRDEIPPVPALPKSVPGPAF